MDPTHDLAILELVGRVTAPALELADSDSVEVGHTVLALRQPFGLDGTLTEGIVARTTRRARCRWRGMARRLIQTDAPINPGNSGGPLVDRAAASSGEHRDPQPHRVEGHGIGFAVPANYVAQLIQSDARSTRPAIAVAPTTSPNPGSAVVSQPATAQRPCLPRRARTQLRRRRPSPACRSSRSRSAPPAQRAGLLARHRLTPELVARLNIPWTGHIITAVDGTPRPQRRRPRPRGVGKAPRSEHGRSPSPWGLAC